TTCVGLCDDGSCGAFPASTGLGIAASAQQAFSTCDGVTLHLAGMARQRLGQHFLADADWREQIARAGRGSAHSPEFSASLDRTSDKPFCWIEIGAGHGEMTEHLASTGAPVTAIEIDAPLVRRLKHLTQQFPNLHVISSDVLKVDIGEIAAGRRV